jgi:hypothetical protein
MPKTYNTIPTTTTGSVYTAAAHNNIVTNVNNYRVPPMCITTGVNTSQSFTHANAADVQFNGVDTVDTDDIHNPSSNSDQFVIATAGVYQVSFALIINTTTVTSLLATVSKNAGGVFESGSSSPLSASAARWSIAGAVECVAGDVIRARVYQTSTSSVSQTLFSARMSLVWLGQVS